jgi:hypothetical protein
MKIKSYLATVILISLFGGFLLEIVLSQHFDTLRLATDKHNQSVLWQKDFNRLSADISQYLISTDLILGSDQTYLIQGALNKGQLIVNSIDDLKQQNFPTSLSTELS